MKKEMKSVKKIVSVLILLFLFIRYWDDFTDLLQTVLSAATPLILGCVIAFVLNITMCFYEKQYLKIFTKQSAQKYRRITGILLSFVTFAGLVFLLISTVLPELIRCIQILMASVPKVVEMFMEKMDSMNYTAVIESFIMENQEKIAEWMTGTSDGMLRGASSTLGNIVGMAGSTVVNFFIALVFAVYLLTGKEKLRAQICTVQEVYLPKLTEKIHYVCGTFYESFHDFIVGQCTEAVILGALCVLGMTILRLPFAMMIGVMIGFTALIPVAGAYIGAVVGAIMILTVSPIKVIYFLIFIVVLQQIEGNLIYPKVVGKSIGLPGIWVLAAITIGGGVLGIGGMLLAVPITSALYKLLRDDVRMRRSRVAEQP